MLEIKNTVTEINIVFDGFINTLDMAMEKNQWAWRNVNRNIQEMKREKKIIITEYPGTVGQLQKLWHI